PKPAPPSGPAEAEGAGVATGPEELPPRGTTRAMTRARTARVATAQGRVEAGLAEPRAGVAGEFATAGAAESALAALRATGAPHWLQKRPPAGISFPQAAQCTCPGRLPPQLEQKRPLAGWPQAGQVISGI